MCKATRRIIILSLLVATGLAGCNKEETVQAANAEICTSKATQRQAEENKFNGTNDVVVTSSFDLMKKGEECTLYITGL